ncbi:response regulator transcription factor [Paenibacillus thalictri]|uniref:Response regulator transcription factor n=1 Tax=Paenibacillus thalictri TaxID=2527873 RepID=A0A4Q9DW08_9BACL|nr:response regulator transcription factor [Paenibacillus thalictri]TBL80566.1 response regulator transcription factor [Paenibacillus thalictri]
MDKVLVLEDEESIRSFVVVNLKRHGYEPLEAVDGEQALSLLQRHPDTAVALLDVMVPGIDGFEVCRRIRASDETIGIIFLTAKVQERDKVMALSLGADDHIGKPFSPAELMARVQSLLRRVRLLKAAPLGAASAEVCRSGPFELREAEQRFAKDGAIVDLTPTELALVRFFMRNPNVSLSRDKLLDEVWGVNYVGDPKIVDVNIRRLRQKIEMDPSKPEYIETVWGMGYRWKGEPS